MNSLSQPTQNDVILATEHLSRVVGAATLVNDITVEIRTRELVALVGPSGSGKSSFLRLLNRLDEPTSGAVYFEGVDYRQIPPRELRRRLGFVTQRAFLFPGSVAENLSFGPRQRGEELPAEEIERLLAQVGLPGFSERNVANLSGGEAQRVSLARALANSPTALLLDEPTSALDQEAKLGIELLIKKIVEQSRLTCVLVTHDMEQAARMADRVMILHAGPHIKDRQSRGGASCTRQCGEALEGEIMKVQKLFMATAMFFVLTAASFAQHVKSDYDHAANLLRFDSSTR